MTHKRSISLPIVFSILLGLPLTVFAKNINFEPGLDVSEYCADVYIQAYTNYAGDNYKKLKSDEELQNLSKAERREVQIRKLCFENAANWRALCKLAKCEKFPDTKKIFGMQVYQLCKNAEVDCFLDDTDDIFLWMNNLALSPLSNYGVAEAVPEEIVEARAIEVKQERVSAKGFAPKEEEREQEEAPKEIVEERAIEVKQKSVKKNQSSAKRTKQK